MGFKFKKLGVVRSTFNYLGSSLTNALFYSSKKLYHITTPWESVTIPKLSKTVPYVCYHPQDTSKMVYGAHTINDMES